MALTGDIAKLVRWRKKIEKLGSTQSLIRLNKNLAEETVSIVVEGFQNETDPYGQKWKRKVFPDGRQVLVGSTTRLRRGWKRTRCDADGFRVSSSVAYAVHHQHGTGIYGPRKQKIVPKNKKALSFVVQVAVQPRVRAGASPIVPVGKRAGRWKGQRIFLRSVKGCPPRMMVPRKGELPAEWAKRYHDVCREWFHSQLKK